MPPAPASNGCSQQTRPAPKWAAPILPLPKSHNHCAEPLVTITAMNAAVGIATAVAMYLCGLGDPLLWGATAFLLNYILILGPLLGTVIFLLVGMLSFDSLWWTLLPPALYFGIHLLEGETLTPMLLARRFTLNPVLVVLSLVFWFWMWGVPGAILAVPLLAILKIISDRLRPLKALGHFLEGE